jgi:hypothetical protein
LPPASEQFERKASCLPSGDQFGCEAVHAPGVLLEVSPMVSGEMTRSDAVFWPDAAVAMRVKCNSEPPGASTAQAILEPSGEMETEVGVRTWPRSSMSDAIRESCALALTVGAGGMACGKAIWERQSDRTKAIRGRMALIVAGAKTCADRVVQKQPMA